MNKQSKAVELFLALGLVATTMNACNTNTPSSPQANEAQTPNSTVATATGGEGYQQSTFQDRLSGAELLNALRNSYCRSRQYF
ncbi:hypothetical protein [Chroogloeocystis siderophila]|jgi:hypothetical protein|uniref:hypothetical protein n=1 Tax=Chroogloeocystis siderophila TaxID=329163 RepID=UPI001C4A4A42|nr:hypothetical protein [Chroogloeocystis siderophila]